jgi:GH3 auxin-responsive promoter
MAKLKTVPGSSITGPALWAAASLRVGQWDRAARSAPKLEQVQTEALVKNCRTAAATEFGRAHRLGEVRTYRDFVGRVPLRSYAEFEPYLERMRQGERDVLWPGLIQYFGQSSGSSQTAAQHKFLPISEDQIRWQQKAGFDVVARYVTLTGDRALTGGYTLGLFPPSILRASGPVFVTNNPGLMQRHVPKPANLLSLPRPPLRDLEDYNQKLTRLAEEYLDYDIRAVSGTSCWFSILFDRVLEAARARGTPVDTVGQVWPNLRVLFGGGVYAEPYRRLVDERVGRPVVLMDNYNATEGGLFAATDRMLMIPDRGVFFEFVPRAEHGAANARRVPLWEVEAGVEYSVVLTTSSGLFGYYIGDSIRFTSTFPHRMEFTGRMSGVLSLTQELTSHIEIERAVADAQKQQPCSIVEFAATTEVGVDSGAKGRYLLFVEFERQPADLKAFAEAFDHGLRTQNRVYREHRSQDVGILAPAVLSLPKGASQQFLNETARSVQQKFPRIVDDRRRELLLSLARSPRTNP